MTLRSLSRLLPFLSLLFPAQVGFAQVQSTPASADQIIAIVNEKIVLKSDVDSEVAQYIQQARLQGVDVEFTKELWVQALESIIDNEVMLFQAQLDSIVVSDEQVMRQMDFRIEQLTQQAGSERALEEAFGKPLVEIRREFRDQFREQLIVSQLQSTRLSNVSITRPEVEEFFQAIPTDSVPTIPEQVAISQIVIKPKPSADVREAAIRKAQALRDSIVIHGVPFEEIAKRHSDGPTGPRGGLIPMMPLNDLVAEYAAAASALEPGEVSTVVETSFGFHVIRLNKRQGEQIETNNLLIQVDRNLLDDDTAIATLDSLRKVIQEEKVSFADAARARSEDPASAPSGGRLYNPMSGERLIPINRLDPSLYRIVLLLEQVGDMSEPRPYTLDDASQSRAFRIVRLDRLIEEHTANLKDDYARIEEIALQRKQSIVLEQWLRDIRQNVYIEYLVDIEATQVSSR